MSLARIGVGQREKLRESIDVAINTQSVQVLLPLEEYALPCHRDATFSIRVQAFNRSNFLSNGEIW